MEHGIATLTPSLTVAWLFATLGFCSTAILAYVAVRNHTRPVDLEKALRSFRSLDVAAFRNLVDAGEETFLRQNLSHHKFRQIKRQRAWAALLYAREAGKAATALAQIGQAAQRNSNPNIAASGLELAENAFRLRLQTVGACLLLLDEVVWPNRHPRTVPSLLDQYERSTHTLFRLRGFEQRLSN